MIFELVKSILGLSLLWMMIEGEFFDLALKHVLFRIPYREGGITLYVEFLCAGILFACLTLILFIIVSSLKPTSPLLYILHLVVLCWAFIPW